MQQTPDRPQKTGWHLQRHLRSILYGAVCLIVVTGAVFMLPGEVTNTVERTPTRPPGTGEFTASVDDNPHGNNPGYLGPGVCAECHRERVDEFCQTNHFKTCRNPVAEDLPHEFHTGPGSYVTRFGGTRFEMSQRGTRFIQTTVQTTESGEVRHDVGIDLVLGAGNADDVYVSWRDDGRMFELPIAWLWSRSEWGASHFLTEYGTGDYSRAMTVRCMECHNTWMDYVPGTVNQYQHGTEIPGVTCERCHGPGSAHVEYHRKHPEDTTANSIVWPAALSRERLIEVCTQCHSNAIAHRQTPFSYRPGEPLEEFYKTLEIEHPEDDHVANQIVHLRKSRCFQGSEMTCISCHDPHRVTPPKASRSASCAECHEAVDCLEQPRLPEPVKENCVGCHMPLRVKLNVKFETERDNFVPAASRYQHNIGVDVVARDEVLLAWHRSQPGTASADSAKTLTDRLVEHWITRAERHRSQFRFLAVIADYREALIVRDSVEIREQLRQVINLQQQLYDDWAFALNEINRNRPSTAIERLKSLLQKKPNDAEAHSKLGTLYAISGQTELAVPHLEAVTQYDPNNPSGHGVLGRIAWLNGRYEEALQHWRQAEELDPYNAQILYDIGLALSRLDRRKEAINSLQRAAKIDPGRSEILADLKALQTDASHPE